MTADEFAPSGITFVNARMGRDEWGALRVAGARIAALGTAAATVEDGDLVVDLQGDRLLPGFINAHDHLQLNNLPRTGALRHYLHVREWISDVAARRRSDLEFEAKVAVPREERLLIGGVKNLLSGVTTVAHHDPLYPCLTHAAFPIRVLEEYGWSHSLYLDGEHQVRLVHRYTPQAWPWIIHAAEGVGPDAHAEFDRLDALDCVTANTVLVHGIALDQRQRRRLIRAGGGLVWCPSSNLRLFGRTADIGEFVAAGRIALGTDSRLSGGQDLFEELRVAAHSSGLDEPSLESLITGNAAHLLRLTDRGELRVGALADLVVLPAAARLQNSARAAVRLVMIDGVARYGDRSLLDSLGQDGMPAGSWTDIRVDGVAKALAGDLAVPLARATTREHGLELPARQGKAA